MDCPCVSSSGIYWGLYMITLFDEVVNHKDIIHLWINGCWCMALRMFKYVC